MSLSPRSALLFSATFASALLISACGKSEAPAPAPAAASTAAAMPAPAPATTAVTPPAPTTVAAPAAATTVAAAPVTPPAAPVKALSFSKLTLGSAVDNDRQVTKADTSFVATDKTIYASVATEGSTSGAKLNAKWSYLEGHPLVVSSITQSIATDGPAVTTFKVQNPDLWPEGKYKVEISLNGKMVADQDFHIAKR